MDGLVTLPGSMLTMDQKQQILHHYRVDEDGLREISLTHEITKEIDNWLDMICDQINSKYVFKKIGNVKRVIYLRRTCLGCPYFKSKMEEIYFSTYTHLVYVISNSN